MLAALLAFLTFALIIGGVHLFRDSMNKIQYLECLRLYWMTRDDGDGSWGAFSSFMRHTAAPFWRGAGRTFQFGKYTFQVGRLTCKVNSLDAQLSTNVSVRDIMDTRTAKDIRSWVR